MPPNNNSYFDKIVSLFPFNSVSRKLIHALKYNELKIVSQFFAEKFKVYYNLNYPFNEIDFIAPVPLHLVKKRDRGFNQAEILTKEIAKIMTWQHAPILIKRTKFTKTQTKLSKIQREKNVANAFKINKKYSVTDKNILIVDDVFTTGSTLNSIAKTLQKEKPKNIFALTIMRA